MPWKVYHGESLLATFSYLLPEQIQPFATNDPAINQFWHMEDFLSDSARNQGRTR